MQKLASAIEEIGRYVEALEKQAAAKVSATRTAPAVTNTANSVPVEYGALLPKLAARLDLEEDAVKAELSKLSSSVVSELSKLAEEEANSGNVSLGSASDYVEPATAGRKKTASSSKEAWDNFTQFVLTNR